MMSVSCPHCHQALKLKPKAATVVINCPSCKKSFKIATKVSVSVPAAATPQNTPKPLQASLASKPAQASLAPKDEAPLSLLPLDGEEHPALSPKSPAKPELAKMLSGDGDLELDLLPDENEAPRIKEPIELTRKVQPPPVPIQRKFQQGRGKASSSSLRDVGPSKNWSYLEVFNQTWDIYTTHLTTYLISSAILILVLMLSMQVLEFALGLYFDPLIAGKSATFPFTNYNSLSEAALNWLLHFILPIFLRFTLVITILCGLLQLTYDKLKGGKPRLERLLLPLKKAHWVFLQSFGAYILFLFLIYGIGFGVKYAFRFKLFGPLTMKYIGYAILAVIGIFLTRFYSFMYAELIYDEDSDGFSAFTRGIAILNGQYLRFFASVVLLVVTALIFLGFNYLVIFKLKWTTTSSSHSNFQIVQVILLGALLPLISIFWSCLHVRMRRLVSS